MKIGGVLVKDVEEAGGSSVGNGERNQGNVVRKESHTIFVSGTWRERTKGGDGTELCTLNKRAFLQLARLSQISGCLSDPRKLQGVEPRQGPAVLQTGEIGE